MERRDHEPKRRPRRALGAVMLSGAAHVAIFAAVALTWTRVRPLREPPPMAVSLVQAPPAAIALAAAPSTAPVHAATPKPGRSAVKRAPEAFQHVRAPAAPAASAGTSDALTGAALAGAVSVGVGPPSGACDMARRVQAALRQDPLVRAAVTARGSGAVMVWDGDWVQSQGEDGKGLAAVREAITWEVAFSPPACKAQPMRGLILLSVAEAPGAARLALGSPQWRWSDLLRR